MREVNRFSFQTAFLLAALLLLTINVQAQNRKQKKSTNSGLISLNEELAKFEQFVVKAKKNGATHVDVTFNVPPALWQYDVPNDPYPEWYVIQPGLMKIFPNDKIRPYVDAKYSERVVALFQARCAVLRKHGIKGAYTACEPYVLPEKFFTDHPELRGARVDHPNRSRTARFSPCVDEPEVLAMYRESMQILLKRCPEIEKFSFLTSDSGSGFCWSPALYSDQNGNANCQHRPMADRVVGFMENLKSAAKDINKNIDVNINPIEPRQWMIKTFDNPELITSRLSEGLTIGGDPNAYGPEAAGWGRESFRPILGLYNPVFRARRLVGAFENEQSGKSMVVSFDNPESAGFYMDLYGFFKQAKPSNSVEMMQVLRDFAATQAGDKGADDLLELWLALDGINSDLQILHFGPILNFGPVVARWINRPLVPFPENLKESEKNYYRPYLFQAKGEEQANNLIDIQAMRMFEGYGARMLVQRVYEEVNLKLDKAENHTRKLLELESNAEAAKKWKNLQNSLAVLRSFMRTVDNVVAYQVFLDLAKSKNIEPEANPVLGTRSTWDRTEIMRIARNEIDNAVSLKKILESSDVILIKVASSSEEETIRMLGPELPSQLKLKIDIMNAHWEDYKKLYTSPNF
jgi:hypothetical protein